MLFPVETAMHMTSAATAPTENASAYPVRLIRLETAAASAGVSHDVIRWAVRSGALKMVRVGKRATGIRVADFEAWIAGLPVISKAA